MLTEKLRESKYFCLKNASHPASRENPCIHLKVLAEGPDVFWISTVKNGIHMISQSSMKDEIFLKIFDAVVFTFRAVITLFLASYTVCTVFGLKALCKLIIVFLAYTARSVSLQIFKKYQFYMFTLVTLSPSYQSETYGVTHEYFLR